MRLKAIDVDLSICKLTGAAQIDFSREFTFLAHTDEELSLVCPTETAPTAMAERDDGWRAFRIEAQLDFSLVGILAKIVAILAQANIAIFAISTYDTDYVLTRKERFEQALEALQAAGYEIER
ncbi:MAG: ACT domain-containing protein [bacterium]|nr:ACT domain-containing protein [bacterium]